MKFFIDTANIQEIKKIHELGFLDGVTTNPSLIAKTGAPFLQVVKEIASIVDGPVSAEVISTNYKDILNEGRELASLSDNIVVKVPLIEDGIKAVKQFSEENIKTNVTLCFSANQALLAAKVGATYISPFIGRLDDISSEGVTLIQEIRDIYDNYDYDTQILAASIRHPIHLKQVALLGADVATIPASLFSQILDHPLTHIGLKKFLDDAQKLQWA